MPTISMLSRALLYKIFTLFTPLYSEHRGYKTSLWTWSGADCLLLALVRGSLASCLVKALYFGELPHRLLFSTKTFTQLNYVSNIEPSRAASRSTPQCTGQPFTLNLKLILPDTNKILNGLKPDHWDTFWSPKPHTYLNIWPPWRTIPFYHWPRFGRTQPPSNIRSGLNFPPVCIRPNYSSSHINSFTPNYLYTGTKIPYPFTPN